MIKINKSRLVHCKKESYHVYIGRGSKWGNPFKLTDDVSRKQAIAQYEIYVRNTPQLIKDLSELKNKILGCWCSPKQCHGEILLKLLKEFKIEI